MILSQIAGLKVQSIVGFAKNHDYKPGDNIYISHISFSIWVRANKDDKDGFLFAKITSNPIFSKRHFKETNSLLEIGLTPGTPSSLKILGDLSIPLGGRVGPI